MASNKSTEQIEYQITALKKRLSVTPEKVIKIGEVKYNKEYFAIKGMISQLEKKLIERKALDFLAR